MPPPSFSIFIQTLNEQDNLPGCLDSVAFADDIVVLDSLSTDATEKVATQRGCRWFARRFDGRGPHQNWAMENIEFKHPWVFYLDADERMTPELRAECERVAADAAEARVAFYVGRKNFFRGRWLKRAMPPGAIMRFFRPQNIRFERLANPVPIIDGPHGYLREHFLHYNFSKGLGEWFERHNRYSTYEAKETIKALADRPVRFANLFGSDAIARRMELKNISFRMPGRPLLKFIYMYILKLGFLDGGPGLTYCVLQAIYEYQIVLKVKELRRIERGLSGELMRVAPTSKLRIVHYHPNILLSKGGVVRAVLDLCGATAARGHAVTLASPIDKDVPPAWRTGAPGVPTFLPLTRPWRKLLMYSPGQLAPLEAAIRDADVLHLHGMWAPANAQIAAIARRVGTPYILSPHGMLSDYSVHLKPIKKNLYLSIAGNDILNGAAFICLTAERELEQTGPRHPRTKGVVIPLLLDTAPFDHLPGPEPARAAFGVLRSGRPVVLLLGRVAEKKGGDTLIRALPLLRERGFPAAAVFAGAPERGFDAVLHRLIDELGLKDDVVFLGQVDGALKHSLCQAADVMAVPSHDENFGLVVPEAVCCGLAPVLSPGVMISTELSRAGGCVVAERTPEAFTEALAALLADPARRAEIARAGRAWVQRTLTRDVVIDRYEELYHAARETPRAMKIIQYYDRVRLEDGGTIRAALDMSIAMARRGHHVTLLTYDDTDAPAAWQTADPSASPRVVKVDPPARPGRFFSGAQRAAIAPIIAGADVVHMHGMWVPSNPQIAGVCRRAGVPYVLSAHGMLGDFGLDIKPLKKKVFLWLTGHRLLRNAGAVHFTTGEELAQARRRVPLSNPMAVPLLFDATVFQNLPGPGPARKAFPMLASDRPAVLLTGRLVHNKGGDVLVNAVAILKKRGIDAVVILAGAPEGGFVNDLKALIERLGVADRVLVPGMLGGELKLSIYQAAQVFALPSIHENFGLVVPEALCCGAAPIVSPGVMIARELEAVGGCVVADRTPEAFADAIAALLADPGRRDAIVRAGVRWVGDALDEGRIGAEFEKMYAAAGRHANRRAAATLP